MVEEVQEGDNSIDWRLRLSQSRDLGTGFAAPGGAFTRALFEWSFTPQGQLLHSLLNGRRVVELGAGIMSFGYALANSCGAKNFVAVEPFYSDVQKTSINTFISENKAIGNTIPHKVVDRDMLSYLQEEPDNLLCLVACGIEDCILPGPDYRKKVENEIVRTMEKDSFFLSSHSDLFPQSLNSVEICFPRLSNVKLFDRLRLHGGVDAFEKYGNLNEFIQFPR
jgi:hypothetical protein